MEESFRTASINKTCVLTDDNTSCSRKCDVTATYRSTESKAGRMREVMEVERPSGRSLGCCEGISRDDPTAFCS